MGLFEGTEELQVFGVDSATKPTVDRGIDATARQAFWVRCSSGQEPQDIARVALPPP